MRSWRRSGSRRRVGCSWVGNLGNGSCFMILLLPESMASSKAFSSFWIVCICASAMTLHVLVGFLDIIRIPCILGEDLGITDTV